MDNASIDGSEKAAERRGRVALERNVENVGFGRAVNQGLARTEGEFVLLLNPDCELRPDALDRLVSALRRHPRSAIAGPKILDHDGAVQGSARGDPTLLTGLFGRSTLLTRVFAGSKLARRNVRFDLMSGDAANNAGEAGEDVDWVSGACMMVRRDMLNVVGGFDERYSCIGRTPISAAACVVEGWSVRYVTNAEVVHQVGQSSRTAHRTSHAGVSRQRLPLLRDACRANRRSCAAWRESSWARVAASNKSIPDGPLKQMAQRAPARQGRNARHGTCLRACEGRIVTSSVR